MNEPLPTDPANMRPPVSAELAERLQDADALTVLEVLHLAIKNQNLDVVAYAARVLKAKLEGRA